MGTINAAAMGKMIYCVYIESEALGARSIHPSSAYFTIVSHFPILLDVCLLDSDHCFCRRE